MFHFPEMIVKYLEIDLLFLPLLSRGEDGGRSVQTVHRPPGPGLGGRQAGDRGLELRERGRGHLLHPQHLLQRRGSELRRNMREIRILFCYIIWLKNVMCTYLCLHAFKVNI